MVTATHAVPPDPLREARRAVRDGQFQAAATELAAAESTAGGSPEWLLLTAMTAWRLGEFVRSHTLAERARIAYRTQGDTDGEMRAQNVAAAGAFARGQLDAAATGFARALRLANRRDDALMKARCTNNLGNVFYQQGNPPDALVHYNDAARLFEQVGSVRGMAEAWHNTGIVWRDEGHSAPARHAADRAVEAATQLGDERLLGQALVGRGESDAIQGDVALGAAHVQRGLDLARAAADRMTECDALRVLARLARASGDRARALSEARDALRLARMVNSGWLTARCAEELARAHEDAGEEEAARDQWSVAVETYRALGTHRRADALEADAGN